MINEPWRSSVASFLENRFILCLGCGLVTSILLWFEKLDSNSYTLIILGTIGAYVSAGVVERSKELRAKTEIAQTVPAPLESNVSDPK